MTTILDTVRKSADAPKRPQPIGGSRRGRPNRTTASVRAALAEAFEAGGGVPALVAWLRDNPTEFYRLWARMLPMEVTAGAGSPLVVQVVRFSDLPEA